VELPDFLTQQSGGLIRLTGHRIGLEHVVYFYNQGFAPEMILGQFPSLPLALIHKVIAFYLDNQQEVDVYVDRSETEVARQRAAAQPAPDLAELRRRAGQLQGSKAC
jgi:uncharacterized protein (DUF433 family)